MTAPRLIELIDKGPVVRADIDQSSGSRKEYEVRCYIGLGPRAGSEGFGCVKCGDLATGKDRLEVNLFLPGSAAINRQAAQEIKAWLKPWQTPDRIVCTVNTGRVKLVLPFSQAMLLRFEHCHGMMLGSMQHSNLSGWWRTALVQAEEEFHDFTLDQVEAAQELNRVDWRKYR